jgi:hypothetical protein
MKTEMVVALNNEIVYGCDAGDAWGTVYLYNVGTPVLSAAVSHQESMIFVLPTVT